MDGWFPSLSNSLRFVPWKCVPHQQFRGSISAESVCENNVNCGADGVSLEPARCMEDDEYPNNLWNNEDFAG